MSEAAREIFAEWTLPFWLTLMMVVTGAVYLRGWLAMRRTRREQFNGLRLLSFFAGLTVLWVSIGSPMDGFSDVLLSVHMVEHLLLMSAVPPLLLYGLPVVPLVRGLPQWLVRSLVGPMARSRPLRRFGHWLVTPLVAWVLMNGTFLGWHVPAAYDFALEHENWHVVEHICFLTFSTLFWWGVLQPWPSRGLRPSWKILISLVTADIVNTILSAFLTFCGRPVYVFYLTHPNPFGVPPLQDQMLGALIMWVFGSFAFLIPAVALGLRMVGTGLEGRW